MQEGQTLVFPGECSDTADFEEPGDVVLTLRRADGPTDGSEEGWVWRGSDLHTRVTVSFGEAILGFCRELKDHPSGTPLLVEWLGGPITHATILELPGKGMPRRDKAGEFGTAYIQIHVTSPEPRVWTSEEQTQLRTLFGVPLAETTGSPLLLQRSTASSAFPTKN